MRVKLLSGDMHFAAQLVIFIFGFTSIAFPGNDNLPVGARSAALNNTSVTLQDVWSVHHNQGGLGFIRTASAGVFYESRFLLPELNLSAAALAIPVKVGTFGLSVRNFGYALYGESKVGFAFGRAFGDNLSIGMQMNMHQIRIGEGYGNANRFTAELGAQYKLTKDLWVGAHVFNPTRTRIAELPDERLPSTMRLGLRYIFSERLFLAAESEKDSYNKAIFRAGVEYRVAEILFLRLGVGSHPTSSSFGFGLLLKRMQVDFTGGFHPVLGFTPQFGLNYQFASK